jgi:hypothetical protein
VGSDHADYFIGSLSVREIGRRTGLHRETTILRAHASKRPTRYHRRAKAPSKLHTFELEIERLLPSDHRLPGTRIRELIEELGKDDP